MNTQGPYHPNPYGFFGFPQKDIPIVLGRNGFLEIINLSNFDVIVTLQAMGTVFQEARSKVLYKIVADVQGTQMLHIMVPLTSTSPETPGRPVRLSTSLQNGELGILPLWLNTYEEGEIEPYTPVSLAQPPAESGYYASKQGSGGFTLVLPDTATYFSTLPGGTIVDPTQGTCSLLGFDMTGGQAAAVVGGAMVISNLNNQPDGSTTITYVLLSSTTADLAPSLFVRFPTPIPNALGNQITFTVPGFSTATVYLTAYYSLT